MRYALMLVLVFSAACSGGASSDRTVTLLTHDSFAMADQIEAFTAETGIEVQVTTGGDAGEMLSKAIITKDNPVADVIYGIDNTLLGRALAEEIFEEYASPLLNEVFAELVEDGDGLVTPIDFGDVCLNYDKAGLAAAGLEPPRLLDDLTDHAYADTLVVQDPSTSSPGLAFLLATIARFGEGGWQRYWTELRDNGVAVTSGWEEAYYGSFSGGSGTGDRPLVVSYASSPPAEVIFATEPMEEAPTGVVLDGCFRQVEYAGIVKGSPDAVAAGELIDFMLTRRFQEAMPLQMFVFPARSDAALPADFLLHTAAADEPLSLAPEEIDANRDRWIEEWIDIVLR